MNHAVLGAGIPFLLGLLCYCICRARAGFGLLIGVPLSMAAGALWAILPDLPLMVGRPEWYFRIHRGPWINLFFWHGHIDRIEKQIDFAPWNLIVAALMLVALLLVAWRELRCREKC